MISRFSNTILVSLSNLSRAIERPFKKIHRPLLIRELKNHNCTSIKSIVSNEGPIVSLTSFDKRLSAVYLAIESIGRALILPSRITLWLEKDVEALIPDSLKRLERRGLEIRFTDDFGPHKKHYPEIMPERDLDLPFIRADDDILYPRNWLKILMNSHEKEPEVILCYRAHTIRFSNTDELESYANWKPCHSLLASHSHFSTGCFGVLFPKEMRQPLREKGMNFQTCCPKADDI